MTPIEDAGRVSRSQLAAVLEVQLTTVDAWRRDGVPHWQDGRAVYFKISEVVEWRIRKACERAQAIDDGEVRFDLMQEQARLAAAKADDQEMKNAVRRNELVEAAPLQEAWTGIIMAIRAGVMALGSRLAPEITGLQGERQIKRRIDQETTIILKELSNERPG